MAVVRNVKEPHFVSNDFCDGIPDLQIDHKDIEYSLSLSLSFVSSVFLTQTHAHKGVLDRSILILITNHI